MDEKENLDFTEKIEYMRNEAMESIRKNTEDAINEVDLASRGKAKVKNLYIRALNNSVGVEPISVRNAKNEKKSKMNKGVVVSLAVSSLVIISLSTHIANNKLFSTLLEKIFGKDEIRTEMQVDPIILDQTDDNIVNSTVKNTTSNVVNNMSINDKYNIGGRFILNDDAKIYTNYLYASNPESLAAQKDADTPSNKKEIPRTIVTIGYLMPDGTYAYAHNREEEQILENNGGVAASVGSNLNWINYYTRIVMPDGEVKIVNDEKRRLELIELGGVVEGFYNVDDINVVGENYKVGGR